MAFQKSYHPLYVQLLNDLDYAVIGNVQKKEDQIAGSPLSYPHLKHNLNLFRYYNNNRIRIIFTLYDECPHLWTNPPLVDEVLFLFVDLRSKDTYKEAYQVLRSNNIIP